MFLARIISFVFHPLLLATYLFGVFAFFFPRGFEPINEESSWRFIAVMFGFTFVFPSLVIAMFKSMGLIDSITMNSRRERILPFILITIIYIVATAMFFAQNEVNLNDNFLKFLLIIDLLVVISTIVTLIFKVSVHSIAVWGFIGILFSLNTVLDNGALYYPLLAAIVVAGIVMSARLKLNVHSLTEVFTGAAIGLVTSIAAMTFLFRY